MTRILKSLIAAAFLVAAGCGETTQTATSSTTPTGKPTLNATPGQAAAPAEDRLEQPIDAEWTIACTQFPGPGHVERSKIAKQQIKAMTGLPGFYVVHEDDKSTLYYGFYRAISPRERPDMSKAEIKDGERAQADLAKIHNLQDKVNGDPLFPMAGLAPLEPVDPAAPADWDLRNVDGTKPDSDPTKAYWSLEIAVYKDSPLRKQYAVDSVKALREYYGRNDFYFYHGKTSSSVCVGAWPQSAVTEKDPDRGSPDDRVLVMPQGTLPGMADSIRDSNGGKVRPVSIKIEPVDPTLIDAMTKFDRRSVNGADIKHIYKGRDGGIVEKYDPSMVIIILRRESGGMLGNAERDAASESTGGPSLIPNSNRGGGSLRSLDGGGQ